ncbi:MAG: bifunctional adenosylcobinamide kinase/adenosylcobinamide-phosphate guanylyltransferase [Bacteroidales bacterium]|nr:bifunctional adenosylcobinamide kinase/adenosylcobinamide-phosphate guanylyltransferase [Bacteroidales bacterium]
MKEIIFITGGQRSGKSSYAQKIALQKSSNPTYLATARVWDDDFKERILHHQSDRDHRWTTIEEEKYLSKLDLKNTTVVLDCITLWLTNFYFDSKYNIQKSKEQAITEWDKLISQDFTLIVVGNELGMGVHPENENARKFADLNGWVNQHIAESANEVFLMTSGIPVKIK